eukprot:m.124526 g.124526  ORF g.124526 m.124526 type:complete len:397 (-) comp22082_c0_seq10:1602-2792(-)
MWMRQHRSRLTMTVLSQMLSRTSHPHPQLHRHRHRHQPSLTMSFSHWSSSDTRLQKPCDRRLRVRRAHQNRAKMHGLRATPHRRGKRGHLPVIALCHGPGRHRLPPPLPPRLQGPAHGAVPVLPHPLSANAPVRRHVVAVNRAVGHRSHRRIDGDRVRGRHGGHAHGHHGATDRALHDGVARGHHRGIDIGHDDDRRRPHDDIGRAAGHHRGGNVSAAHHHADARPHRTAKTACHHVVVLPRPHHRAGLRPPTALEDRSGGAARHAGAVARAMQTMTMTSTISTRLKWRKTKQPSLKRHGCGGRPSWPSTLLHPLHRMRLVNPRQLWSPIQWSRLPNQTIPPPNVWWQTRWIRRCSTALQSFPPSTSQTRLPQSVRKQRQILSSERSRLPQSPTRR